MRVTWNGAGSAWSRRFGNSSAVVAEEGHRLLVDCGHTVPSRLGELGIDLRDIGAVFISHLHGDHVYGLEEWGFKNLLIWNIRPVLFVSDTIADALWTNVLAGTMAQVCNRSCELDDYFDVVRLRAGIPRSFGPMTLEIHPVDHVPHAPAYGLKVTTGKSSVGFTCDSLAGVSPWFYADTSIVFHDCAFYPPFPETVHAHFSQLLDYPEDFRRKTFLVHYGDELADLEIDTQFQSRLAASRMRITRSYEPIEVP